jgi:dTDP-3-amino-2,3,6-trideoxy-4-keto-D-glucose/dTDP-3-amino-3,4,6-trideoxy-alpha-D-glucose/dTDP-2,6-dideoxy-D-kanosamine transaminase
MIKNFNFLPKQYKNNNLKINHNYLSSQFLDHKKILSKIAKVVKRNDFTLGQEVNIFENNIKKLIGAKHVVAVGSGTDAIFLSLKCLNIKEGDEVITTPFTFYATIGAIATTGAKPVFADVNFDFNIDPREIEKKITKKTKAIIPVHWGGKICDMKAIMKISKKYSIPVIEDSCHAILAKRYGKFAGNFGKMGCFSLHPLKNLNVWGDGGYIVVKSYKDFKRLSLMRNHGLVGRNKNLLFGYNSRLDTIQAVVANHLFKKLKNITKKRINNSLYLDKGLKKFKNLELIKREPNSIEVFHLYCLRVKNNKRYILNQLIKNGIDVKVHYPVPMHLQPAAKYLRHKVGHFPNAELIAKETISLPVHEFITKKNLNKIISIFDYVYEK